MPDQQSSRPPLSEALDIDFFWRFIALFESERAALYSLLSMFLKNVEELERTSVLAMPSSTVPIESEPWFTPELNRLSQVLLEACVPCWNRVPKTTLEELMYLLQLLSENLFDMSSKARAWRMFLERPHIALQTPRTTLHIGADAIEELRDSGVARLVCAKLASRVERTVTPFLRKLCEKAIHLMGFCLRKGAARPPATPAHVHNSSRQQEEEQEQEQEQEDMTQGGGGRGNTAPLRRMLSESMHRHTTYTQMLFLEGAKMLRAIDPSLVVSAHVSRTGSEPVCAITSHAEFAARVHRDIQHFEELVDVFDKTDARFAHLMRGYV